MSNLAEKYDFKRTARNAGRRVAREPKLIVLDCRGTSRTANVRLLGQDSPQNAPGATSRLIANTVSSLGGSPDRMWASLGSVGQFGAAVQASAADRTPIACLLGR